MNYKKIIEALKKHYDDLYDEDQEGYEERDYESGFSEFAEEHSSGELEGIGKWEEVNSYGGEDQGTNWYSIRHFIDHNVFVKITGYYTSYNGVSFDEEWSGDITEVFPREKIVAFYTEEKN